MDHVSWPAWKEKHIKYGCNFFGVFCVLSLSNSAYCTIDLLLLDLQLSQKHSTSTVKVLSIEVVQWELPETWGYPNSWMVERMEKNINMDDLGVPGTLFFKGIVPPYDREGGTTYLITVNGVMNQLMIGRAPPCNCNTYLSNSTLLQNSASLLAHQDRPTPKRLKRVWQNHSFKALLDVSGHSFEDRIEVTVKF